MAYAVINFKTKKDLKQAVQAHQDFVNRKTDIPNGPVKCFHSGIGMSLADYTGKITIEGPHFPAMHTWYAEVELLNGVVVKVK